MPDLATKRRTRIQRLGVVWDPELKAWLVRALDEGRNPTVAEDAAEGFETVLIDGPVPEENHTIVDYRRAAPRTEFTVDRYQVRGTAREVLAAIEDKEARWAQEKAEEDRLRRQWKTCPECNQEMRHTGAGRRYCDNPHCPHPGHD